MTYIIAEAGVNHDGNIIKALELVNQAKWAGADAVKFQLFNSQELWGDERIAHLQLSEAQMKELRRHAMQVGIDFLCTPFSLKALDWVAENCPRIKIASGCIEKKSLLRAANATKRPVILSTGMATYQDIREALVCLTKDRTTLLHCTSAYPAPIDQLNLAAMSAMRTLGCAVGYSDHSEVTLASVAAAAMGATVIEKHMTLDRNGSGPDHRASVEPAIFKFMVDQIRLIEIMQGSKEKAVQPSEMKTYAAWRGQ